MQKLKQNLQLPLIGHQIGYVCSSGAANTDKKYLLTRN